MTLDSSLLFPLSLRHSPNCMQREGEPGLAGTGWGPAGSGRSWRGPYCSGHGTQASEPLCPARLPTLQLPPGPSPQTCTGDTLVQSAAIARALQSEVGVVPLLAPPIIPPPVFFCTVEPNSAIAQKGKHTSNITRVFSSQLLAHLVSDLDQALSCISREDPSLRVSVDRDTGQVRSLPQLPVTSLSHSFTYTSLT